MKEINITFDNNSYILFSLLQNEFVEEWFEEFKLAPSNSGVLITAQPRINLSSKNKLMLSNDELLKEIKTLVNKFATELNIVLPINLEVIGRKELNRLHRFFTSMTRDQTSYDESMRGLFKLPMDKIKLFSDMCSLLNDLVHCTEQTLYSSDERLKKITQSYGLLNFKNKKLKPIKREHWKYLSTGHSVLINSNILGKSYFNAYCDNDCPLHKDIMNEEQYSSDLEFEFKTPNVYDMLQDNDYLTWLKSYNINPSPLHYGRMAIGNIVNHTIDLSIENLQVSKIDYA